MARGPEAAFQNQVIHLATMCGWKVAHFRPARVQRNGKDVYCTPMQGHPGYPDLSLARSGVLITRELKTDRGIVSTDQQAWLEELGDSGDIWRPKHWDTIESVLMSAPGTVIHSQGFQ